MPVWKQKYLILENKEKNKAQRRVTGLLKMEGKSKWEFALRTDGVVVEQA